MDAPAKPVPLVSPWARPFWDATREHRLIIQQCGDCKAHVFYPRIVCPSCGEDALGWVEASGRGTVYSFTVVHNNAPSAFAPDTPFVIAVIRLEEGVQMLSNVVDYDPDELVCDMPVEVAFEKRTDEFTMPVFRPVGASGGDAPDA